MQDPIQIPIRTTWYSRMTGWMKIHKIWTSIIILVIVVSSYEIYRVHAADSVTPQYVVAIAHRGNIVQTVTGTGQVSAENQLDVTSQVSGEVQSIAVSVGQHVTQGQLLATIDPHDAAISLQNAKIAYEKLTEAPKTTDVQNSKSGLAKSYNDAFNDLTTTYVDLPTVMSGLDAMLYGQGGFLSDANSIRLNSTALPMRQDAGISYDAAAKQYLTILSEFQGLSRTSATSSIDQAISDTISLLNSVSAALQKTQSTVNYIIVNEPDYYTKNAPTAAANLNAWTSTVNSDLSGLVSTQTSITSSSNSLSTLLTGADTLDVESQQLSLEQAQETYDKYFIRAPFDGTVGRIPVSLYQQASASTVMATIVGDQKISTISLNEVDAAKVAVGQPVSITFDAIDNFTATGTVEQVDQVGTVTQGVVSYGVKILINTSDPRIKPGMSLNTTITTKEDDGVLVIPSSAVKASGGTSYVQIVDPSAIQAALPGMKTGSRTASSTNPYAGVYGTASTTASSTRSFQRGSGGSAGASASLTISTAIAPTRANVTTGDSDDTNIEITGGLTAGQAVVVRTVAAGTATATAAPSLLSGIGGNRAGATRTTGAAATRSTGGAALGR